MALPVLLHDEKVVRTRQVVWTRKAEHRVVSVNVAVGQRPGKLVEVERAK